jgi:hypothetical protein
MEVVLVNPETGFLASLVTWREKEEIGRQSGSHKIYRNDEGKRVTVPWHARKTLHPKLLQSILKDADLSLERFRELLR